MTDFPWWIQCIENIAHGLITVSLGILLLNLRPGWRRALIIAFFFAIFSLYLESLPLVFGLRIVIILVMTSAVSMVLLNLNIFQSMLVILLGITVDYLLDGATIPLITSFFHTSFRQASPGQIMLLLLIQLMIAALGIYLCIHKNIYLLDLGKQYSRYSPRISSQREKLILGLYVCILFFIVFEMMYNLSDFGYYLDKSILQLDLKVLDWISNLTVIAAVVITSVLLKQLLELSEKESEYAIQKSYLDTLEELHTAVRAQQHDLINHFQTLYGFLQLQHTREATRYLESLIGDTPVLKSYVASGSVPLSVLFYIKSGLAIELGINFHLDIRAQINNLNLPPYELNRMLGNLINNAFDAAANQKLENRWVKVKVDQTDSYYVFEISNYGTLSTETCRNMLKKGFTTKNKNHSGLGLHIVKELVEQYEGRLVIKPQNNIVTVSVFLPRPAPPGK